MRREGTFLGALALAVAGSASSGAAQAGDLESTLDRIVEEGQGHEMALRMVRMGMEIDPGKLQKRGQTRFICSLRRRTGSHVKHLQCNENEILNYLVDAGALGDVDDESPLFPLRKEGSVYFSDRPLTEGGLEEILGATGPVGLNRRLVAGVIEGKALPDGVPGWDEIEAFARALAGVKQVRERYDERISEASGEERRRLVVESDRLMAESIKESGLTVKRYNEISGLVTEYGDLRQAVLENMPDRS